MVRSPRIHVVISICQRKTEDHRCIKAEREVNIGLDGMLEDLRRLDAEGLLRWQQIRDIAEDWCWRTRLTLSCSAEVEEQLHFTLTQEVISYTINYNRRFCTSEDVLVSQILYTKYNFLKC